MLTIVSVNLSNPFLSRYKSKLSMAKQLVRLNNQPNNSCDKKKHIQIK
jgi:hypothetical protein